MLVSLNFLKRLFSKVLSKIDSAAKITTHKGKPIWKQILSQGITTLEELEKWLLPNPLLQKVISQFPMFINPYYLSLIETKGDPIYKQCIPDILELDEKGLSDPLNEENLSPVPGLTHRYPDRVLLLVSNRCAVYCRFCNRRRKVGKKNVVTGATIEQGIQYIKKNREIRDVVLSFSIETSPKLH